MPYPADIHYPAAATKTNWLKQKSLIDKTGKTGIGPKLEAAEKAWGEIPFADLDDRNHKPKTSQEAQTALNKANTGMTKVTKARAALKAAIDHINLPATTKGLTGASKTAVQTIVTQLKAADKRLENMDDIPQMFTVDLHNVQQEEQKAEHEALAELHTVQVKAGATLVATAKTAKRQADGAYWAEDTDWKAIADHGLKYLQQELTVTGTTKNGKAFSEKLKLYGIVGSGTAKFKKP